MRVIDAVLTRERAEKLGGRAEECGHAVTQLASGEDSVTLRVLVLHGDPDEFLEDLRHDLRKGDRTPDDGHYVVLEPLAVEPHPDDESGDTTEEREAGTDEIETFVEDGVRLTRSFLMLSGLAGVLAAGGLILNNVAVVVGAMVLAPLFKPIALVGVAALLGHPTRMLRGLAWTGVSLAISAVVGGLLAFVTPGVTVTDQIVARTGVSAFDLIIALAAGLAMALTLIKRDITAMVGIVVAASLVPVAAAIGVVAAVGDWGLVAGGVFTLVSNVCGILLGLTIGLRLSRLEGLTFTDRRRGEVWGRRSIAVGSALVVVLAGIAWWSYAESADEAAPKASELSALPGVRAAMTASDGTVVLLVSPELFTRPSGLPASTVVVPVTADGG